MIIFLRFLPLIVALVEALTFYEQTVHPLQYPWIVVVGVLALPAASVAIAWGRVRAKDVIEKMTPSFVLIASLAFAMLLTEGRVAFIALIGIATVCSFISLEMLFLYAYDRSRYPVNGLARINIAYVPVAVWYTVATSSGLMVFVHSDRVWHVMISVVLGAVIFRTTEHPAASKAQNAVWTLIGAIVGAHVGLLGLLLPVSLPMQGIIASIIMSTSLRTRRYLYDPKPTPRQAWTEGILALAAFILVLSTAKWL